MDKYANLKCLLCPRTTRAIALQRKARGAVKVHKIAKAINQLIQKDIPVISSLVHLGR